MYESVKYIQQENFWIGPSSVRALAGGHHLSQESLCPVTPSWAGGLLTTRRPIIKGRFCGAEVQ